MAPCYQPRRSIETIETQPGVYPPGQGPGIHMFQHVPGGGGRPGRNGATLVDDRPQH